MKREAQTSIEINAVPKTSLLVHKIRTRLLTIVGCLGIILIIFQMGQSTKPGEGNFILYAALAISLICLVDLCFIFPEYRKAKRMDNQGTLAVVLLRKKYQAQVHVNNGYRFGRDMDFFFLEYELPKGVMVKCAVSKETFETLPPGNKLSVSYLDEAPTCQRIE